MLRYVNAFLNQAAMSALAHGRSTIEQRLARWLLMADDRIAEPELPLTHEFLAMMLGVTRPGVTVAVQSLERPGLIARRRASLWSWTAPRSRRCRTARTRHRITTSTGQAALMRSQHQNWELYNVIHLDVGSCRVV